MLVAHVHGEFVDAHFEFAVFVIAEPVGGFVGLIGVFAGFRVKLQRAVDAFHDDAVGPEMDGCPMPGIAAAVRFKGRIAAGLVLHVQLSGRHAVGQVRAPVRVGTVQPAGNSRIFVDIGLFRNVEDDIPGGLVDRDVDSISLRRLVMRHGKRGPVIGSPDRHGQGIGGFAALPSVTSVPKSKLSSSPCASLSASPPSVKVNSPVCVFSSSVP